MNFLKPFLFLVFLQVFLGAEKQKGQLNASSLRAADFFMPGPLSPSMQDSQGSSATQVEKLV
jgi:hypothetical protein